MNQLFAVVGDSGYLTGRGFSENAEKLSLGFVTFWERWECNDNKLEIENLHTFTMISMSHYFLKYLFRGAAVNFFFSLYCLCTSTDLFMKQKFILLNMEFY